MKKISTILLILMIVISVFSACTQTPANNLKEAVVSAENEKITLGEFRYILESIKGQITQNQTEEQLKEFWETEKDGKMPEEIIKDQAIEAAVDIVTIAEIAKTNGITITDSEVNAEISKSMPLDQLKQMADGYKTDVDSIKAFLKKQMLVQKYYMSLDGDPRMQPSEEELKVLFQEKYIKAQHILKLTLAEDQETPLPEEEKANKKKEIDELLVTARQKNQDFQTLMMDNSEDPGSTQQPDGYIFTEGEMVEEFYHGALALADNEISDVIETSYGYHIIKRLPLDVNRDFADKQDAVANTYKGIKAEEIIEELKPSVPIQKNDEILSGITVK